MHKNKHLYTCSVGSTTQVKENSQLHEIFKNNHRNEKGQNCYFY